MNFKEYKELVRIRLLLDENPAKAKQLLTGWIKGWEELHFIKAMKKEVKS